jgi:hypothetical protein
MFTSKKNNIIKAIADFKKIKFDITELKDNIYEIVNQDKIFYIVFEPENIFTSIDHLLDFKIALSSIDFKSKNILRIPYFAGCSGFDLGYFLLEENTSISDNIDYNIDYSILPVDFNYYGFERYLNYMDILIKNYPIFKGNNNILYHYEYFIKTREEVDGKINLVIPLAFIRCFRTQRFLNELVERLKEDDIKNKRTLEQYLGADDL